MKGIGYSAPVEDNTWWNGLYKNEYPFAIGPTFRPPPGAGVGLVVGTNGIIVVEHSASHFSAVLKYQMNISGWTHIGIVNTIIID